MSSNENDKKVSKEEVIERSWLSKNFVKSEFVFHAVILLLIWIMAFSVRLFSVFNFESMIHEYDPWFNFRSTKYLVDEGFYEFHNWFDKMTWYPLGRWVGNTVYPGLMWTSGIIHIFLHKVVNIPIVIRNVCVMLAPFMAGNTALATYGITKEIMNGGSALFAAFMVSLAPGYISRSVAGSYDNECVAIFAMVFAFYLWVKAVKTGNALWGALAGIGYFYMVSTWGGYIFVINLIPLHVFVLLLAGKYTHRLYVAYNVFYCVGTLSSMCISFVTWAPITSTEHYAAMGVFGLLQIYTFYYFIKSLIPEQHMEVFIKFTLNSVFILLGSILFLAVTGFIPALTGRLWRLLGATSNIAIVKSVSEHQPSAWTVFFFAIILYMKLYLNHHLLPY